MNIWITEITEPLPSTPGTRLMRCGILAEVLVRHGCQVTWWTSNFDHVTKTLRAPPDHTLALSDHYRIRLLPGFPYRRNVSFARVRHHRRVAAAFADRIRAEQRPDLIFSCLPTLEVTQAAVAFAREQGVPIVVDVRDLWPDAFVTLVPAVLRPVMRLLIRGEVRRARAILGRATGITAVSDEYLKWGLRLAGRAPTARDGVFPLGYPNTEFTPAERAEALAALEAAGVDRRKVVCCFVGSFGRNYDLSPVIATARSAHQGGDGEFQFVLAGDGERRGRWEREAAGLPNLVFTGWLSSASIGALLEASSVAIAAYTAGVPQGLPNKVFEYLSAGLPILSSLRGETERLLAERDCGFTYEAGSAESFAGMLRRLQDAERRRRMGRNGLACFEAEFSPARIYDGLVRHIESVAADRR